MKRKNKLANLLRAIAKEYDDDEEEVDSVYITTLNADGSVRMIPFDAEERSFDNSAKTICYLGNGLLKDAGMIGLASELTYVKKNDEETFQKFIELLHNRTEFEEFDTLYTLIEEMSADETHLDFSRNSENFNDDEVGKLVQ